jgi:proteasome lid subunit RPN8/RPN11
MSKKIDLNGIKITQKHYDTIVKQGFDNLPKESGGFVGGDADGFIKGILPIHNQYLFDKTATFGVTSEDFQRAYAFFEKNNLSYYCVYHTHPDGVAFPSQADINTGQRYHLIICYANKLKPEMAAFKIINNTPIQIPVTVVANPKGSVSTKDLKATKNPAQSLIINDERDLLNQRIANIIRNEPNNYERLSPKDNSGSDFSTFA